MDTVHFLAQLWGFSLVIVSLALLINPRHMDKIFQFMKNETRIILSGIVGVILGVALILNHNIWDNSWRVIVTILGWGFLCKGIVRLFFPKFVINTLSKIKNKPEWIPFYYSAMTILGCFLVYAGFAL